MTTIRNNPFLEEVHKELDEAKRSKSKKIVVHLVSELYQENVKANTQFVMKRITENWTHSFYQHGVFPNTLIVLPGKDCDIHEMVKKIKTFDHVLSAEIVDL